MIMDLLCLTGWNESERVDEDEVEVETALIPRIQFYEAKMPGQADRAKQVKNQHNQLG